MDSYKTTSFTKEEKIARVCFNRPEVHNAFNSTMIRELDDVVDKIGKDKSLRVVILTGNGKSFCAGADIKWLREIVDYSFEQNLEESLELAEVLYKIYVLPKPTIAMVNGTAFGGGTGFLSVCDIAVASEDAKFGLSEVKIGLVPAAISPYVIRRIGEKNAREYFLTGERISAQKAQEIGLVNKVVPHAKLKETVDETAKHLLTSGPEAIASCKELIYKVPKMSFEEAKTYTARMIANLRVSEEGQEGTSAFLEKRKPSWIQEEGDKTENKTEEEDKTENTTEKKDK
ncbi:MAG: enoyl-CoA hydratase/isomerase family protein [Candidatus Aminicenantes bacterium]|nr:MAG: enoyl-CoA hydratase/isomerase family protein [Candidatus Aminicenantes bacterium]